MSEINTAPLDKGFSLLTRNEMSFEYDPLVRMIKWNIQTIINNYNKFREKEHLNPYPELKFDLFINTDNSLITKLDIEYPNNIAYYNEYNKLCKELTELQKELTKLQTENKILKNNLELYKSIIDNKEPINDNVDYEKLEERIYQDLKKEYSV